MGITSSENNVTEITAGGLQVKEVTVDGSVVWPAERDAWVNILGGSVQSVEFGGNGLLYAGTSDGYVHALNPDDGSVNWSEDYGTTVQAIGVSPTFDDRLYIGGNDEKPRRIDGNDGSVVWTGDELGESICGIAVNEGMQPYIYVVGGLSNYAVARYDVHGGDRSLKRTGSDGIRNAVYGNNTDYFYAVTANINNSGAVHAYKPDLPLGDMTEWQAGVDQEHGWGIGIDSDYVYSTFGPYLTRHRKSNGDYLTKRDDFDFILGRIGMSDNYLYVGYDSSHVNSGDNLFARNLPTCSPAWSIALKCPETGDYERVRDVAVSNDGKKIYVAINNSVVELNAEDGSTVIPTS